MGRFVVTSALALSACFFAPMAWAEQAADPLAFVASGLRVEDVAQRAMASSYEVQAASGIAEVAAAREDEASAELVPRLTGTARYTRLSDLTQPPLVDIPVRIVATQAAAGTLNPTPTQATALPSFAVPTIVNQFLVQAQVLVPLSDYVLRINKSITAATRSAEAARFDVAASKAKSYSDAKLAYYTWVRARGARVVAEQVLATAREHLHDADMVFRAGRASNADVARARTEVAASELEVERGKSGVSLAEWQVRLALHTPAGEKIEPGEDLAQPLPALPTTLASLVSESYANRPEIKSIDKNAEAAMSLAGAVRAAGYPSLSAYGDATYADPNPRVFPPRADWTPTWSLGAQLTWTPTAIFGSSAAAHGHESRASALEAQRKMVRDQITLEVIRAFNGVNEANVAIETSARQLESALEAYRVARDVYAAGRGISTAVSDAEAALARARFQNLNARVDIRAARVRLEHAVGRDGPLRSPPEPR